MINALTDAHSSAKRTVTKLQEALSQGDPVAALLLLPMIAEAAGLARRMDDLLAAARERNDKA